MSDETVTLDTNGLLSKWGFGDGDILDDLLDDHDLGEVWRTERDRPDDTFGFGHRVLMRVVEAYVLPALREHHVITIYQIHTLHNPIRATTLDGEPVDTYNDEPRQLTPATVTIPVAAVLAIATEERARHASNQPKEQAQ